MTWVVEIFLPLRDNRGRPFPDALYEQEKAQLVARFGGVTAYSRAPAQGLWARDGETRVDTLVILEVVTERVDAAWWRDYRRVLEATFVQEAILVRATQVDLL